MHKAQIQFDYQAPYYKSGDFSKETESIWIIFHGYGQLVDSFQSSFQTIDNEKNILLFPQGLSRFYLKGAQKEVGASWMTSYERQTDIDNYINYLDLIYEREVQSNSAKQLNILAFSQGAHTASRWIYHSGISYSNLILWGAGIAHEIDMQIVRESFSNGRNTFVVGNRDRFVDQHSLKRLRDLYRTIGLKYELISYDGGHEINPEILSKVIQKLE
jgi:predicted esterase